MCIQLGNALPDWRNTFHGIKMTLGNCHISETSVTLFDSSNCITNHSISQGQGNDSFLACAARLQIVRRRSVRGPLTVNSPDRISAALSNSGTVPVQPVLAFPTAA
uniref:Uncharacterized protein n=1 Tax=Anguilla anguilla TaxID=7936 RepID=A0A0E9RE34_ANGAN